MTKKQMISIIALWFFTIGIFSLGFSWLVLSKTCDLKIQTISRMTDNQNDFLLFYKILNVSEIKPELRIIINKRENLIKMNIERFRESCRSKKYKRQLVFILNLYRTYLLTKQAIFRERQDFTWQENLMPLDFGF